MMKQKIFNWILLVLVITTSLSSQVRMKQQPKSYLWGLIKIPNDSKNEKVPIYISIWGPQLILIIISIIGLLKINEK